MEATLTEYRVRYIQAVFTAKRLLDMADEAKALDIASDKPDQPSAHDCLVAAAEQYTKRFEAIAIEAFKAFPGEAARALAFDASSTHLSAPEEPKA